MAGRESQAENQWLATAVVLDEDTFNEKLIELVKVNKNLYDKRLQSYRNRRIRLETWTAISKDLGRSEYECIQRWKSLRDRYRREITKRKIPSGGPAPKKEVEWEYFNHLNFLDDQMKPNNTKSNYKRPNTVSPSTSETQNIDSSGDDEIGEHDLFQPKRQRSTSDSSQEVDQMRDQYNECIEIVKTCAQTISNVNENEDDLFGLMIAAKLKKLQPVTKAMGKLKIFEYISKLGFYKDGAGAPPNL